MSYKKTIFTGTLILTLSGFLSRILGFYNRIFLSNLIGAKELGIYQLIFPVYMLFFTLVCHGFETGISNLISRFSITGQKRNMKQLIHCTCVIAFFLSLILAFILLCCSDNVSQYILKEASTAPALKISSLALPFVALKSCLHGYYIGMNRSSVPAASQLIEQITRVSSIYLLSLTLYATTADATIAVWGMVCGEMVSSIYTIFAYLYTTRIKKSRLLPISHPNRQKEHILPLSVLLKEFFSFSIPLTINHFSLTIVNSLENMLIPFMLIRSCGDQTTALEIYGTLTGMALPFLFFPATIVNSLSVMLLPAISSSFKQKKMIQIQSTISKSIHYCVVIGIFSTFAFLIYGNALGEIIFHSTQAGHYVYQFAILCPFMYVSQTISSILNGFGNTRQTLYHNLIGVGIRIAFILTTIPSLGIAGYLYGLLAGYGVQIILNLLYIFRITSFPFSVEKTLLLPSALALAGSWGSRQLYQFLFIHYSFHPILMLAMSGIAYFLFFTASQIVMEQLST